MPATRYLVLVVLVVVHLVAGWLVAGWMFFNVWSISLTFGIIFGQVGLVGNCAALMHGGWKLRWTFFVAGFLWLTGLNWILLAGDWQIIAAIAFPLFGTAAFCLRMRRQHVICYCPKATVEPVRVQFSVRQVIALTLLAAVLLTLRKGPGPRQLPRLLNVFSDSFHAQGELELWVPLIVYTLHFIPTSAAAAWAALRPARPWIWIMLLLACAPLAGLIPKLLRYEESAEWYLWPCVTMVQTALVAVTCLVLRWSGYRLARVEEGSGAGR
jgi:hypothetical protein